MPSSYEQDPIVELTHWSVYEVPLYGVDAPWTRHFIGFAPELGLAQLSSAILMFDREHSVGASANHRIFQLLGQSGHHQEAARLWAPLEVAQWYPARPRHHAQRFQGNGSQAE